MIDKNNTSSTSLRTMAFFIILVLIADQITKIAIVINISAFNSIEIIPNFFNLVLTYNRGAAFGLMSDLPDTLRYIALTITTVIALGVVWYFLIKDYRDDPVAKIALGMIVGGAVGNIIDRIRLGMVVDFLDIHYAQYHWPAFNIADSAICIGVIILILRKPKK